MHFTGKNIYIKCGYPLGLLRSLFSFCQRLPGSGIVHPSNFSKRAFDFTLTEGKHLELLEQKSTVCALEKRNLISERDLCKFL